MWVISISELIKMHQNLLYKVGETFSGKLKDSAQFEVQFSKATNYKPGKKYVIEIDTAYQEYQPYALFELHKNCQGSVFLCGQVSYPRGLDIEQSGSVIFNNLLTKFEVNIDLQKKVNLKEMATVENGITTMQFKMVNNKRKIPIA
ncbi:unnamed protein product [Rhizophagus irregularis]|nr:unnamed protein product [Rhizophagus irregularis]